MSAEGQWYEVKPELALHIRARKARTVRDYLRYFASKSVLRPLAILTDAFCHAVVVYHAKDLVLMYAHPALSAAEGEGVALREHPEADAVVTVRRGAGAQMVSVRVYTPSESWTGQRHLPGASHEN